MNIMMEIQKIQVYLYKDNFFLFLKKESRGAITVMGTIVIVMVMIIVTYFLAKTAPLLI